MNEKFKQFKTRVKNTVKDHAPELITFGASALALVAYATYVTRTSNASTGNSGMDDIVIMESDGEGHAVVSNLEALLMMEGNSKTRYKLDDDHYYNFVRSENPTD